MNHFVYILQSECKRRLYTGITTNVNRRLEEHNSGKCRFTSGFTPWRLIHVESFATRGEARIREKYYKTGGGRRATRRIAEA